MPPFDEEFIQLLHSINDPLISRGRFVSPALVQNQYALQVELACKILKTGDASAAEKALSEIDDLISVHWFHPSLRAFYCHRSIELPYIENFSHQIEKANLHYFRQDYLSAVMLLVPVIEGIMVRHFNVPLNEFKRWKDYKQFLEQLQPNQGNQSLTDRMSCYRDFLITFLNDRFFCRAAEAALSFDETVLNRNYILHQLGDEPFYDIHDCQTLFQLIDLYIELVACQTGKSYYPWVDEDAGDVRLRTSHYWTVILKNYYGIGEHDLEERLLKMHKYYKPQTKDTNYLAIQGSNELLMLTQGLLAISDSSRNDFLSSLHVMSSRKKELLEQARLGVILAQSIKKL